MKVNISETGLSKNSLHRPLRPVIDGLKLTAGQMYAFDSAALALKQIEPPLNRFDYIQ